MEEKRMRSRAKTPASEHNLNTEKHLSVMDWLNIFSLSSIPVIGLLSLIIMSLKKPKTEKEVEKKIYAKARLCHRFAIYGVLIVCGVLAYMIVRPYVIEFLDKLEML